MSTPFPAVLSLRVYPDMYKNIQTSSICQKKNTPQMFVVQWIKQIVAICDKAEDYTVTRMNKILVHVASWMDLT